MEIVNSRWSWFKHDVRQLPDHAARVIAWWLPKRLVLWCVMRVLTDGVTLGDEDRKLVAGVADDWARKRGLY